MYTVIKKLITSLQKEKGFREIKKTILRLLRWRQGSSFTMAGLSARNLYSKSWGITDQTRPNDGYLCYLPEYILC